jgi:hypothetical protein
MQMVIEMNQFERAVTKAEEDMEPQLHVVARLNEAAKPVLPAPLRLPSRRKPRQGRPELAVLGWERRNARLAA